MNGLDTKIRMENGLLKQELNEVKTMCANFEVENEEIELRNEALQKTIDSLEDKLDEAYKES